MTSPMPSEPRTGHQLYHVDALAPAAATKVVATAIVVIYAVQIVLFQAGLIELAAAALADLAVLVGLGLYARANQLNRAHFGLRRPRGIFVGAAVLIGLSAWYLNLWIVVWISPPGGTGQLQTIVEQTPLVSTLGAIALLPAIVEELVFRGVFVRALAKRFVPVAAIVIASIVFSVYHLLPVQIVSTFGLALALGYLTLRADSAIPAIVAHLLNNAIAIVVSRDEVPGLGAWMGAHPTVMLAGTAVVLACGLVLVARGDRRKERGG
jgi:membrane protease YdiL (CAAX protease family)